MDFSKLHENEAVEFLNRNGVQVTSQNKRDILLQAANFYRERANLPNFGGVQFTMIFLALDRAARFPSNNKYTMSQIENMTPQQMQQFGDYYKFDATTPYAKKFLWRLLELQGNTIETVVQPQIVPAVQPQIQPAPQPTVQPAALAQEQRAELQLSRLYKSLASMGVTEVEFRIGLAGMSAAQKHSIVEKIVKSNDTEPTRLFDLLTDKQKTDLIVFIQRYREEEARKQPFQQPTIQPFVPQIQPLIPAPAPVQPIQPFVPAIQPQIQPFVPNIQPFVPAPQPFVPQIQPFVPNVQPTVIPNIQPIVMSPVKINSPAQPLQQGFGYMQNSPVNIQQGPMSPGRVTIGYSDTQVDDTNNMVNATSYSPEFRKIRENENIIRTSIANASFNAADRLDASNPTYNLMDVTDKADQYLQSFQSIQRAAYVTTDSIFAASAFKRIEPYRTIDMQKTVRKRAEYMTMLNNLIPANLRNNIVIAGGCILKYFLLPVADNDNDVDLFIVGTERPELILIEYMDFLTKNTKFVLGKRSPLAVTVYHRDDMQAPISIILRRYKSPSEIMAGFDLDASCFCFYQGRIWTSLRGDYALRNRTNTVDITRISPSYNYRLLKYAMKKGFRVQVPGLNKNNRMKDIIIEKFTRLQALGGSRSVHYYGCLGLYTLLMMEVSSMTKKNNEYQKVTMRVMSDYDVNMRDLLTGNLNAAIADVITSYDKLGTKDNESLYFEGRPDKEPRKRKSIYYTKSPVLLLQDNALQGKLLPVKPVFITENPGQQGYYTGSFFPIVTTWEEWRNPEACVAAEKDNNGNMDRDAGLFTKFATLPAN